MFSSPRRHARAMQHQRHEWLADDFDSRNCVTMIDNKGGKERREWRDELVKFDLWLQEPRWDLIWRDTQGVRDVWGLMTWDSHEDWCPVRFDLLGLLDVALRAMSRRSHMWGKHSLSMIPLGRVTQVFLEFLPYRFWRPNAWRFTVHTLRIVDRRTGTSNMKRSCIRFPVVTFFFFSQCHPDALHSKFSNNQDARSCLEIDIIVAVSASHSAATRQGSAPPLPCSTVPTYSSC